jgi:ribonuclease HI
MNIKIAKAYCTTPNDALCILTGNAPVEINAEEAANLYRITKDKQNQQMDYETQPKDWTHPADTVRICEQNELTEHTIHKYTDRSKNEHRVGWAIAIFIKNKLTHQIKHKLYNRCSNNQAEQTALLKALLALESIKLSNNTPRRVKVFTDSKITLSFLKNAKNKKHLIEEIRKKTTAPPKKLVHRVYVDKGPSRTQRKRTSR